MHEGLVYDSMQGNLTCANSYSSITLRLTAGKKEISGWFSDRPSTRALKSAQYYTFEKCDRDADYYRM